MIRVLVCSAYSNLESNLALARKYSRFALEKGVATFAPHIEYSSILSDADEAERELGINAGLSFLMVCGEMWVFVVKGVLTTGMNKEIKFAIKNNISIRWFDATDIGNIRELVHLPPNAIPLKRDFITKTGEEVVSAFAKMEAALRAGKKYSECTDELDDLLGTTLTERDPDAEETYEAYRDLERRENAQ
jgi:hypothetical protein